MTQCVGEAHAGWLLPTITTPAHPDIKGQRMSDTPQDAKITQRHPPHKLPPWIVPLSMDTSQNLTKKNLGSHLHAIVWKQTKLRGPRNNEKINRMGSPRQNGDWSCVRTRLSADSRATCLSCEGKHGQVGYHWLPTAFVFTCAVDDVSYHSVDTGMIRKMFSKLAGKKLVVDMMKETLTTSF